MHWPGWWWTRWRSRCSRTAPASGRGRSSSRQSCGGAADIGDRRNLQGSSRIWRQTHITLYSDPSGQFTHLAANTHNALFRPIRAVRAHIHNVLFRLVRAVHANTHNTLFRPIKAVHANTHNTLFRPVRQFTQTHITLYSDPSGQFTQTHITFYSDPSGSSRKHT